MSRLEAGYRMKRWMKCKSSVEVVFLYLIHVASERVPLLVTASERGADA